MIMLKTMKFIKKLYPIEAEEDKTATWDFIVEKLIYNLKNK